MAAMRVWICPLCMKKDRFSSKDHLPAGHGEEFRSHPVCRNCVAIGRNVVMMPVRPNDHLKALGYGPPPKARPEPPAGGDAPALGGDRRP